MTKAQPPVTILGAGTVGICTALSLVERGVSVRIIDVGMPGQETSFGNAGVISPFSIIPQSVPGVWKKIPRMMFAGARPLSVRAAAWPRMVPWGMRFLAQGTEAGVRSAADAMDLLCAPSVDLYRRHLAGTGSEDLLKDSIYVHAFRDGSRARLSDLDYAIRSEKGAEQELVGKDELHRIEPALSPSFEAAILIKGQARTMSPGKVGTALAKKAAEKGAVFVKDEIGSLSRDETGWKITCSAQTFHAKTVVVALGVWSTRLLEPLGLKLPLMAERGYHVEFPEPKIELNNSIMDMDAKTVSSSMEGGLRMAGQAEFAPIDAPPDPRRQKRLERVAREAFPGLKVDGSRFWMGRRPSFPDSLPALGHVDGLPGLHVNFGHSHYGLMMAPKSGEIVADLITDDRSNLALAAFSPHRFD